VDAWGVCGEGVPKDHPQTAVVIVVNSFTLTHYEGIDQE